MGRKKGGKNPEGHRAGGARSGAGRPRKAGPLTLKASIRVHAHDPALFVRRDAIHPALRELIDTPAHFLLACTKCGHSDPAHLVQAVHTSESEFSSSVSAAPSQFSRSATPPVVPSLLVVDPSVQVPHLELGPQHKTAVLFTPPQSVSPVLSQEHNPNQDAQMDESTVAHAESLLMLSTPVQTVTQQSFDIQQEPISHEDMHPHQNLAQSTQQPQQSLMQPSHLEQPMQYDSTCHFAPYIHQTPTEPYQDASVQVTNSAEYQVYHPIQTHAESDGYCSTPNATATATPPFSLDPSSPVQAQTQAQGFHQSPVLYHQTQPEYEQHQPAEYDQNAFYTQTFTPDMYIHQPQPQIQSHPHRSSPIKPGPASWRHAPHSSSLTPPVAAVISPHSVPVPVNLDPSGPVHFLPTGQHSQRRRRRCVICINAGRGEDADRCCGRGNRHLCPWYSRHGSPENIMDIRNPKDVRQLSANLV
ncbi:hypothetical protein RhiJN_16670 [Ceratobasidium sp. AG-Ba]|nr:hypothetical protein RhiJN_16670 [Ceratobasidium sp. AG-Ba]